MKREEIIRRIVLEHLSYCVENAERKDNYGNEEDLITLLFTEDGNLFVIFVRV